MEYLIKIIDWTGDTTTIRSDLFNESLGLYKATDGEFYIVGYANGQTKDKMVWGLGKFELLPFAGKEVREVEQPKQAEIKSEPTIREKFVLDLVETVLKSN